MVIAGVEKQGELLFGQWFYFLFPLAFQFKPFRYPCDRTGQNYLFINGIVEHPIDYVP
jgi:hypothetical protein